MIPEEDRVTIVIDDPFERDGSSFHVSADILQQCLHIGPAPFRGVHVKAFRILRIRVLQQGLGFLLLLRSKGTPQELKNRVLPMYSQEFIGNLVVIHPFPAVCQPAHGHNHVHMGIELQLGAEGM
jgi:hypothetical protein